MSIAEEGFGSSGGSGSLGDSPESRRLGRSTGRRAASSERRVALGSLTELVLTRRAGAFDDELVAVHRLLPHARSDAKVASVFAGQARRAASLAHPNLVEILEVRETAQEVSVVAEYLCGEALSVIAAPPRVVPIRLTCYVMGKAAAGLQAAHDRDVLHLDVRPSHIVVTYDGAVKLVEVGLSVADPGHRFTRAGTVRHRIAYTSPEAIQGHPTSPRSDVFSLGVILWELLARRPLFSASSPAETAKQVLETELVPPSVVNPAVPAALDGIVLSALNRDPDARMSSAKEVAEGLEQVLRSHGPEVTNRRVGEWMRSKLSQKWTERRELERDVLSAPAAPEPPTELRVAPMNTGAGDHAALEQRPSDRTIWLWGALVALLGLSIIAVVRIVLRFS